MIRSTLSIIVLAVYVVTGVQAREQNVNPDINRHYQGARFEQWLGTFERQGREVYDKRQQVVDALDPRPGMAIADIGAGTGFYSLLFAQRVGNTGKVYAVDITKDFVDNILRRASDEGLANIEGIVSTQTDTRLPPASIDLAFVCATYHHFEYPQSMLASMYRALRPGGQLVIIDFRKQAGRSSDWVMSHVRGDEATVVREVEQAGFRFVSAADILQTNYFLRFVKVVTDGQRDQSD